MGTWIGPVRETPAYEEYPVELRQYWADTIQLDDRGLYWYLNQHAIVYTADLEPEEQTFKTRPWFDVCPVREEHHTWYVEADTLFLKESVLLRGDALARVVNDTLILHLADDRPFVRVTRETPDLPEEHVDWCLNPEDGP